MEVCWLNLENDMTMKISTFYYSIGLCGIAAIFTKKDKEMQIGISIDFFSFGFGAVFKKDRYSDYYEFHLNFAFIEIYFCNV
jgi:hypothetical protein